MGSDQRKGAKMRGDGRLDGWDFRPADGDDRGIMEGYPAEKADPETVVAGFVDVMGVCVEVGEQGGPVGGQFLDDDDVGVVLCQGVEQGNGIVVGGIHIGQHQADAFGLAVGADGGGVGSDYQEVEQGQSKYQKRASRPVPDSQPDGSCQQEYRVLDTKVYRKIQDPMPAVKPPGHGADRSQKQHDFDQAVYGGMWRQKRSPWGLVFRGRGGHIDTGR